MNKFTLNLNIFISFNFLWPIKFSFTFCIKKIIISAFLQLLVWNNLLLELKLEIKKIKDKQS